MKSRSMCYLMGSLLFFLLMACSPSVKQHTNSTNLNTGTITLYFRDNQPQCTFPIANNTHYFVEDPHPSSDRCKHLKDGSYFKLTDVPSATNFWLVNGRPRTGQTPQGAKYCTNQPSAEYVFNWWKLTTIKEPTTMTDAVHANDLHTYSINDVVVPGVRLTGKYTNSTTPADPATINCLIIEVSP